MAQSSPEDWPLRDQTERNPVDELRGPPVDSDIDTTEDSGHRSGAPTGPFATRPRTRWPRIHWRTVAMVGVGGFLGGITRYEVGLAWSTSAGTIPWSTFTVNTAGAFVLALLLVLVLEVLPPSSYLRPAIGTGFCGALTTFSSVAVQADRLAAHGYLAVAVGYVAASVLAGLAAASFGIVIGRSVAAHRAQRQE